MRALEQFGLSFEPLLYEDYKENLQDIYQPKAAYFSTKRIMESPAPPSAFFAASDLLAVGILKYLHEKGIAIPEECSVVGFDNIPIAQHMHPALTTIDQKPRELGRFTGNLLLRILREGSQRKKRYSFTPSLVVRESSTNLAA